MEDGVTDADCDLFQCQCGCDLTAGVCDYNCCCDPDCSTAQKTRFSDQGCSYEGYMDKTVPLCYNSLELYAVNPRTPLSGEDTASLAVGDALCIEKYNYATSGDYYSDTTTQSADIFTGSSGQKDYSYGDDAVTSSTLDAYYDKGDNIAAFKGLSTSKMWSSGTGYFSVPAADFTGKCNDFNFVTFEDSIESRSCDRVLAVDDADMFAEQCVSSFGVSEYATNLFVGATANIAASGNTGANFASNVVQVEISSVYYEERNTSTRHNVTADWIDNACDTQAFTTAADWVATSGNPCRFAAPGRDPHEDNLPICMNMVKSVDYTVIHAGDDVGTITAVRADIVVMDVLRETHMFTNDPNPVSGEYNQTVGENIRQSFSVSFRSSFTGTESSSNGNIVERSRSGNPGYIMGKPVLFGSAQSAVSPSTLVTVEQTVEGVQVPSPLLTFTEDDSSLFGQGACPILHKRTAQSSIGFGYDVSSSCKLELTRTQLEGLCCRGSSYCTSVYEDDAPLYTDTAGVPYYFTNVSTGYVGIFGNADPLDVSQWISLNVRTSTAVREWDSLTGICKGMVSGVAYKFLTSAQGELLYPQNKILAAEVEYVTSDWHSVVPHNDSLTTQTFPLTVTVEFVSVDEQSIEGYAPPAPPVLFKVPYDVFYPFFASPAAPQASASVLAWLAPLVCALLVMPLAAR